MSAPAFGTLPPSGGGSVEPTDAEVIARVLAGDRDAFAVLVERYRERLYWHALGMVGSEEAAADFAHDVLTAAYFRLATLRDPSHFGAWVWRTMRHRCIDHLRNVRRRGVSLEEMVDFGLEPAAPEESRPDVRVEQHDTRRAVAAAVAQLSEKQRTAFVLHHVEGRPILELVNLLHASEGAVKMRVHRARELLRAALVEGGIR